MCSIFTLCVPLVILFCHFSYSLETFSSNERRLLTSTNDIQINIRETDSFQLYLSESLVNTSEEIAVFLSCEEECKIFSPNLTTRLVFSSLNNTSSSSFTFNITALSAGHDVIIASTNQSSQELIDDSQSFVRVRVGHSNVLTVLSAVVGWTYFVVWSASFWPQNITNWRRRSVVGLNLDFAALNFTGFLFYTIFNSGLYYSPRVHSLYSRAFPRSEIPVQFNDVIYSIHAACATGLTLLQCALYDRGGQTMSIYAKAFLALSFTAAAIQLGLCLTSVLSWLTFLYYFSYVKLIVTCVKYAPQAWFNYKRKSTQGWTVYMIYMDISGGVFGLLQMLFIAYNFNDWKTIFGNFAKFGLSVASIVYDILFLLQEFVFYPKNKEEEEEEENPIKSPPHM